MELIKVHSLRWEEKVSNVRPNEESAEARSSTVKMMEDNKSVKGWVETMSRLVRMVIVKSRTSGQS